MAEEIESTQGGISAEEEEASTRPSAVIAESFTQSRSHDHEARSRGASIQGVMHCLLKQDTTFVTVLLFAVLERLISRPQALHMRISLLFEWIGKHGTTVVDIQYLSEWLMA